MFRVNSNSVSDKLYEDLLYMYYFNIKWKYASHWKVHVLTLGGERSLGIMKSFRKFCFYFLIAITLMDLNEISNIKDK